MMRKGDPYSLVAQAFDMQLDERDGVAALLRYQFASLMSLASLPRSCSRNMC